jgi:hypothetical protein
MKKKNNLATMSIKSLEQPSKQLSEGYLSSRGIVHGTEEWRDFRRKNRSIAREQDKIDRTIWQRRRRS